jgi:cytochrome c oxidase subunit 3/cytochrome o ubiquinol oxidase subunit 3
MYCLIAAEAAMFTIFVVAYLFYAGKSLGGPTPKDVLHIPILVTVCLLSSSATIHLAVQSWKRGAMPAFARWWLATLGLGAAFLAGTALEWRSLIVDHGLTIQTNLFGTTYYALVGLHAFHVAVGLVCLAVVSALALLGYVKPTHVERGDVLSLYWHFVDSVWVVVFVVVYVIGR